ncbi:hypothetical protein [Endozoicomonas lisbonensis]|uniref:hypothetical protein n=1 Tax=Endozoicomonas lisbonensis TaxID=3120522 RepID=UPI003393CFA3
MSLLLFTTGHVLANINLPYTPNFENNSRVRTMDGATCEARTAQATVQMGVYDTGNSLNQYDQINPIDSRDRDRGVYAQIAIPLDLGGGRQPDCSYFQQIMEENAELDLQLKRLEVELKMNRLKKMQQVDGNNTFSE